MREDLIELLRKRAADHGGDKLLEEAAAALEAAREDERKWRFAANGPQGTFYTEDLGLAASILRAYDKNDDWTVTDVVCPIVTLGASAMKAIDQTRGKAGQEG